MFSWVSNLSPVLRGRCRCPFKHVVLLIPNRPPREIFDPGMQYDARNYGFIHSRNSNLQFANSFLRCLSRFICRPFNKCLFFKPNHFMLSFQSLLFQCSQVSNVSICVYTRTFDVDSICYPSFLNPHDLARLNFSVIS